MIQLCFTVILCEMALLLSLLYKNPLKNLLILALDCLKQGQGPAISTTVLGVLLAVLVSTIYSITNIHHRSIQAGSINPTDQILIANKMLLASLSGFLLFFSMMIDRLHQLLREQSSLKKIIIAEEKQLAERKYHFVEHVKALEKEIVTLKTSIKKQEFEYERKANQAKAANANETALREQAEEFIQEYDRLLEYNQTLRDQLQSIDQSSLKDNQKSGWSSLKSNMMRGGIVQFPWGIQTSSKKSREGVGEEIEVPTTNQSATHLCSGGHVISSLPRHRRPIYQH